MTGPAPSRPPWSVRETVVAGLAVAFLSAGLGGVWWWPSPEWSGVEFGEEREATNAEGFLAPRTNQTFAFRTETANLTRVVFVLTFQDDVGSATAGGDVLSMAVVGPNPDLRAQTIRSANTSAPHRATLTFALAERPRNQTLAASEVNAFLSGARSSTVAAGWNVTIDLVWADDWHASGVPPGPCDMTRESIGWCKRDAGNSFLLGMEAWRYVGRRVG